MRSGPTTDTCATAKGARSCAVTSPSSPSASWRARIESGSFRRGHLRVSTLGAYGVLFADLVEEDDLAVADAEVDRAALAATAFTVEVRTSRQRELRLDLVA